MPRALPPHVCPHADENRRSNSIRARVCHWAFIGCAHMHETHHPPTWVRVARVWQGLSRQPALSARPTLNIPPKEWHLAAPFTALQPHTVSRARPLYVALSPLGCHVPPRRAQGARLFIVREFFASRADTGCAHLHERHATLGVPSNQGCGTG